MLGTATYDVLVGSSSRDLPLSGPFVIAESDGQPNVASSKYDCKNGGWRDLVDGDGNSFRDQGQGVASGGRSR